MIYALDENIGKIISTLKIKGLYDDTVIIFTSDNGGLSTLDSRYKWIAPTSTYPLRAGKGWLYEGGIRVPLLIKPKGYNKKQSIVGTAVIGHDLYPTILSQAKINKPKMQKIDGHDLSPLLNGKELNRNTLFWHYPHYHGSGWRPGAAIRCGNLKLIEFYETNTVELYDLSKDISEQNDISSLRPEKAKSLRNKLHQLQKSINANQIKPNPKYSSNKPRIK